MTNRLLQRSQSSPQADDTTKTIAKRLETYYRASIPVIAYYETKTQLRKVSHSLPLSQEPDRGREHLAVYVQRCCYTY